MGGHQEQDRPTLLVDCATLRAAREVRGVSLREMAREGYMSRGHLTHVELGERPVSASVVAAYQRVLGPDLVGLAESHWRGRLGQMTHGPGQLGAPRALYLLGLCAVADDPDLRAGLLADLAQHLYAAYPADALIVLRMAEDERVSEEARSRLKAVRAEVEQSTVQPQPAPTTPAAPTAVGQRIRLHRERSGKTQAVVGGLVGRSPEWVSSVETGRISPPSLPMLAKLARALGVPVTQLLDDEREVH